MKLSIVIPVYNVETFVGTCLDSILNQNLDPENYEILVINDGSTDDSLKIVENYAEKNVQIKVFTIENGGAGKARNYGMAQAKGKYLYFIDSDDYLMPHCLNFIVETCENHDLDILTFKTQRCRTTSIKPKYNSKKIRQKELLNSNMLSEVLSGEDYVASLEYRNEVWWYVINRGFLEGLGVKFEEGSYLEDAIFTIRIFLKAQRMAYLNLEAHRYRIAPESVLNNRDPVHYNKLIKDMQSAALDFSPIVKDLEKRSTNPNCILRIIAKQQALVFFSMVRMLQSTMSLKEVKHQIDELSLANVYPLDLFLGKDYNQLNFKLLVPIFNNKKSFYFLFRLINPILRPKNKL